MTELRVTLGQHSQPGRKPVNQDFHGAVIPVGSQLRTKGIAVALADGISSSAVSQEASCAAVRSFLEDYYASSQAWPVRRAAQRILEATNSWLHAQTQQGEGRFDKDRGHVCTFTALILKGGEAHVLHVGDSRVYRLHAQTLEQLTEDHVVRVSSSESHLGRALGAGSAVEIDYRSWATEVGEIYLLATDGACAHLDGPAVQQALARHPDDLDQAAADLTSLALARGSMDNLTVQLLRIDELPAADTPYLQARREGLRMPPVLQAGALFEGYRVVRELHASSRSHVYQAIDEASGRQVVLKTPSVDMQEQGDYLDGFLLEEWIARRIDNTHVLKAFIADRPREHLFVAMAYVEGQTLAQWMIDHPLPDLGAVRNLVEQIAKGLTAFHRKEMLHQDLRPENILIDHMGTVRIIDFASTHVAGLTEGTASDRPEAIRGSLQYTAPEYFVNGTGSARSELFSLAVLTYQMLTGQLPYGLDVARLRSPDELSRLRYIPLRERRADLPAWLDAVLRRALHPRVDKRQEALSEFIHDLHTPGPQYRSQRAPALIERDPVFFWKVATLVLGLTALLLLGLRIAGH